MCTLLWFFLIPHSIPCNCSIVVYYVYFSLLAISPRVRDFLVDQTMHTFIYHLVFFMIPSDFCCFPHTCHLRDSFRDFSCHCMVFVVHARVLRLRDFVEWQGLRRSRLILRLRCCQIPGVIFPTKNIFSILLWSWPPMLTPLSSLHQTRCDFFSAPIPIQTNPLGCNIVVMCCCD